MTDKMFLRHVRYQQAIEYEVVNTLNLFQPQNLALLSAGRSENARRFVVVDSNVDRIYSSEIRNYFSHHRVEAKIISFASAEETKSMDSFLSIARELDSFSISTATRIGSGRLLPHKRFCWTKPS